MSHPTDADLRREFRTAARVMTGIAAAFFTIGAAAVAVADAAADPTPAPVRAAAVETHHHDEEVEPQRPATADPDAPLVVEVTMGEFFFTPDRITVPAGRLVRFEVSNPGVVPHEFLVGDRHAQDAAEKAMAKGGPSTASGHTHEGTTSLYLEAGATGVVETTFDSPGELLLGCHVPGHYVSGMKGTFMVAP